MIQFRSFAAPASERTRQFRHLMIYAALGGIIGVLILHPVNSIVVWMEYGSLFSGEFSGFGQFAWERVSGAPFFHLMAMNAIFSVLGAVIGVVFSMLTLTLSRQARTAEALLEDLQMALPAVIAGGENERTEFKSTLRWDIKESRTNRSLEQVIAKTIAGFMNHQGGRLLIGVADDGQLLGINPDLKTLRSPTTDDFERALIGVVKTYLGSAVCPLVRSRFLTVDGKTICWVLVERSDAPVFLVMSDTSKYFVRLGNSTRELNAAEAHDHISRRNH
ncbi:MAG TPA: ATP-binding protein [Hyphomonas adhaerens]|uniref:ATP-binding protein n=2 Tax=Hyphomonadaceae TaxID=69657 RepID=A0A3B9GTT2_9PROT|nr:AAA family ATPase [Hyphomonas sp.]HAE25880.1 ATP-binding protein [Hyphomonas adhaerens]